MFEMIYFEIFQHCLYFAPSFLYVCFRLLYLEYRSITCFVPCVQLYAGYCFVELLPSPVPSLVEGNSKFLEFADLQSFEIAFRNEGVIKLEHITDVIPEDLKRLGR